MYKFYLGWYYKNANDKSPSWTGVEYLHNYLTRKNKGIGPIGKIANKSDLNLGDIIQLSFKNKVFTHSLIVTLIQNNNIYVSTHTEDNLNKPSLSKPFVYKYLNAFSNPKGT